RPVGGGDDLVRIAEDPPDRAVGGRSELSVGVVEQVERPAAGGLQNPPVGRDEKQRKGLALAGRGDPADVVAGPEDFELVALRPEERDLAETLAVGGALQR